MKLPKIVLIIFILAALIFPNLANAAAPESAGGQYALRLPEKARSLARQIKNIHMEDYGTFIWTVVNDAGLQQLQDGVGDYQEIPDAFTLTLGEQSFDPLETSPAAPIGWDSLVNHSGPDLYLVQYWGPTRSEWLAQTRQQGLEIVQYIAPFSYVVWGQPAAVSQTSRTQASVRWTGPYIPAYRVLPQWRDLSESPVDVRVMIYRGADTASAIQQIQAAGGQLIDQSSTDPTFLIAHFLLSGTAFRSAASVPGVFSIQPVPTSGGLRSEMSDQVNVGNYDDTNLAFPGYQSWLTNAGVNGSGVIIADVDAGIDQSHPDLANRMAPCTGSSCGGSASDTHGTHTAGIMAADGSSGVTDSRGFLRGLGVAPGAQLVEQLYDPTYTYTNGLYELMTQSYRNGASISGNSWGPSAYPVGYDMNTRQVDIGVRDADPDVEGNQSLNYVLSIMNGHGGVSSQGTPDEAKNAFTIGSTKLQNYSDGSQDLNINDLSSNTGQGPALDGRLIPHMVAPGCQVDSTTPGASYLLLCGTSMASPQVSGAAALFIQYYRSLFSMDPSPAMVKAAFLPVAHDLAGHLDADGYTLGHPFDAKQGWGRMDLAAVITPSVAVKYFDAPAVFSSSGEEWTRTFTPADPSKPVRLMLVWTDAPGAGNAGTTPAWVNDLDLEVTAGAATYRGNNFDNSGWSLDGGSADGKNNTEGIFLGPTPPSIFTVHVVAANIAGDGIPNNADTTDQDFALACYNCGEEPDFALYVTPTSQTICAQTDASFTVNVDTALGFNQPVTLSASGSPAGSTVSFNLNPVTPLPGSSLLTLSDLGTALPGDYSISIQGTAAPLSHTITANLSLYTAAPSTVPLVAPADQETDLTVRPAFSWSPVNQAQAYTLQVDTDAAFPDPLINLSGLTATSYTPSMDLVGGTTYYWRVTGINACGEGVSSAIFSFTTYAPVYGASAAANPNTAAGDPGDRISYLISLTNTGNVSDSFDFSVASPLGWIYSSPSTNLISAGGRLNIPITVTIPSTAVQGNQDAAVVSIYSHTDPGAVLASVLLTTTVNSYAVSLSTPVTTQVGAPGEILSFDLTLSNNGDTTDTFYISIVNPRGWSVSAPSTITLNAGASQVLHLKVSLPSNALPGDQDALQVQAISQNDPSRPPAHAGVLLDAAVWYYRLLLPFVLS